MLRVGLTGGYATGKSFVGRALGELGCCLIQADQLGHEVLLPGGPAYRPAIEYFGEGILNEDGTINRKKLAAEVFGNPERLELLSSLVHPPVIEREEALVREFSARDPGGICVVEAAILIETGSYRRFNRLVLTVCGEEQQVARAVKRDHVTAEEARDRIRRQMPLAEKRKYADYIIDTSGSKENTLAQTAELYSSLRSIC